jgi:beta-mannosidase
MQKQIVHENWTVRAVGDLSEVPSSLRDVSLPATVPGCVHTDLLRAGKIDDPYRDRNEFAVRWIGHTDWEYRTTFDADPKVFDHERIDLVCDGLDTVATIVLNGSEVARAQNMHRGYRFDFRSSLRRGSNELVITFASPVKYAEAMQRKLGRLPYVNSPGGPFNFIRKMACNFGWDWGPALPTSGIWRPIRLEAWSGVRIASVRVQTMGALSTSTVVDVLVELDRTSHDKHAAVQGVLKRNGQFVDASDDAVRGTEASLTVNVPRPEYWWPRGHGDQPLYDLRIEADDDVKTMRIGLRTVELDTSPDEIGAKFVLKVNGKPIFCKGFNWIPDDCFLDRACEPTRVRRRIQQAVDAGANMLRVWGGGIFETDDFYDVCDEMGLPVWQDFLFACAMYPEEEPFKSEVEAEARYNVARLAHHPSLAIWNGCNENIWAYRDWGWKDSDEVKGRAWGLGYYLDLLPRIVKELDPSRPYWAASPWSGDADPDNGIHPNADTHGNMHCWAPWFREDYDAYRKFAARFCSEFGFQGPATYGSIASVVPPEARDFGSPEMRHRQKSGDRVRDDGDRRNLRHLLRYFNLPGAQELLDALEPPDSKAKVPYCGCEPLHPARTLPSQLPSAGVPSARVNFDDLHYLLQVNQARALTLGVEWFRSRQPRCMGTLYWQLNDCWPGATSWSCIDGDGRPKPLWYATRKFFSGLLATFQPEPDGSLSLFIINDQEGTHDQELLIHREDFEGKCLAQQFGEVMVPPRSIVRVPLNPDVSTPNDPTREYIYANGGDAMWFFLPDKAIRYSKPVFDARWDGRQLLIRAKTLLRDVCVFVDRLDPDATVNQQLVTIMPGSGAAFAINSKLPLKLEQLTAPPIFRCVNSFGDNIRL